MLAGDSPIGPGDVATLLADFSAGARPPDRFAVGAEFETMGLHSDSLSRIGYGEVGGVRDILSAVASRFGWRGIFEGENLIALSRDEATITIEPGGQMEFSGPPHSRVDAIRQEICSYRRELEEVGETYGVQWLWMGLDPLNSLDQIDLMPKDRYRLMDRYLPTRGRLARRMMRQTCSVQCGLDYRSEQDAAEKIKIACALNPIITAMAANSPFVDGRPTGYRSFRTLIWREVDPDRCGIPPFFIDGSFSFERYFNYLIDTPMFFVLRGQDQHDLTGVSFRRYLSRGAKGLDATYDDWLLHTSTVFPELRLKKHLELRCMDAMPPGMQCSLPALWRGLLYDDGAREAVRQLLGESDIDSLYRSQESAARLALKAPFRGATIRDYALETISIASEGLRRLARERDEPSDESCLDPLTEMVTDGRSPADHLIERYEGEGGGRAGIRAAIQHSTSMLF